MRKGWFDTLPLGIAVVFTTIAVGGVIYGLIFSAEARFALAIMFVLLAVSVIVGRLLAWTGDR